MVRHFLLLMALLELAALVAAGAFPARAACGQTSEKIESSATQPARSESGPKTQSGKLAPGSKRPGTLAVGRVIYAQLTQTIDVKKVKVGAPVFAKTTLAVLSGGKVLIENGARITGHVTRVQERSEKNPESELGIVFDRVELPDGKELPLNLTVQAVGVGSLTASPKEFSDSLPFPMAPGFPDLSTQSSGAPSRRHSDLPKAETGPALDLGSKGMVGLKGLELTEGTDDTHGSLVKSKTKNVKLDNYWQMVLRVIAPKPASAPK